MNLTVYSKPTNPLLAAEKVKDRFSFFLGLQDKDFTNSTRRDESLSAIILFADGLMIQMFSKLHNPNLKVHTWNSSEFKPRKKPKYSLNMMVASGISSGGKSKLRIVKVKRIVSRDYYWSNIFWLYVPNHKSCNIHIG